MYYTRTWEVELYFYDFYNDLTPDIEEDESNPNIREHFLFLRHSTITSFFSANQVDMPVCFKKSKSLYSKTFELPLLKFVNLIMRGGRREQALKFTTLSFNHCFFSAIHTPIAGDTVYD